MSGTRFSAKLELGSYQSRRLMYCKSVKYHKYNCLGLRSNVIVEPSKAESIALCILGLNHLG